MWLLEDTLKIIFYVVISVVPFVGGGLLIHWAFGGKKENKAKNEKLFETTAYFNALGRSLPRKFR